MKADFEEGIGTFLKNRVILMSLQIETGVRSVSLQEDSLHVSLLIKKVWRLKADCLQPMADQRNPYLLTNAKYFFTPLLNGCQLAIYKLKNGETWVEHHNDFSK